MLFTQRNSLWKHILYDLKIWRAYLEMYEHVDRFDPNWRFYALDSDIDSLRIFAGHHRVPSVVSPNCSRICGLGDGRLSALGSISHSLVELVPTERNIESHRRVENRILAFDEQRQ